MPAHSTRIVDLTLPIDTRPSRGVVRTEELTLGSAGTRYVALIYRFNHDSMQGTYLDLPGHIRETDDGDHAANYPAAKLFRIDTHAIHLDRAGGSGAVTARELAASGQPPAGCGALIVNALGRRRFDRIAERSVWLAPDAVRWIAATGIHLLISDIYERNPLLGVFPALFRAHVCTVCHPVNLHRVRGARVRVTVLVPRYAGLTQLPCRALAECEG